MTLSTLTILLGLAVVASNLPVFINLKAFKEWAAKFPRSIPAGYVLMGLATAWFLHNLSLEETADFLAYKKPMMMGFGVVGVMTCIYVTDFLPVRGLAVLLLLLAKEMLDTARWVDSQWRLVVSTWAYLMIIAGMWWTVAPWRFRDLLNWAVANDTRLKLIAGLKTGFGILLLTLGWTAFRS